MKHGPIALIDENFPSLFTAPRDAFTKNNERNGRNQSAWRKNHRHRHQRRQKIARLADDVIYIQNLGDADTDFIDRSSTAFRVLYGRFKRN